MRRPSDAAGLTPPRPYALERLQLLEAIGEPPPEHLWRAAVAERLGIEHAALGWPRTALAFRLEAARILLGLSE